jgi:hypothetical protein
MACEALWPRFVLETTVAISETLGMKLSKTFHELYFLNFLFPKQIMKLSKTFINCFIFLKFFFALVAYSKGESCTKDNHISFF